MSMPDGADPGAPNAALADRLAELAALLRARRTDRFRVRAYERAADVVRALPVEITALSEAEVRSLEGIGAAVAGLLAEHERTGRIGLLDELRAGEPPGFGALLGLPLLGVRDARALAGEHGLPTVAALRAAAATAGGLDGLGNRLAGRVRESLRRLDAAADSRLPLPLARRDAEACAAALATLPAVRDVLVAGSVRRGVDTVDGLDLVLVTDRPGVVSGALPGSRAVVRVLARHDNRVTVVNPRGRPTGLWLAEPGTVGAALLAATGSAGHVGALDDRAATRGMRLRVDGLWRDDRRIAGDTEPEIYAALGLAEIPPELRESSGEAERAAGNTIPRLVELPDLRGDLHVHSDWSRDGKDTLDDMVAAAAARGYAYVAVTDHAENLAINGMSRDAVRARRRALADVRERHPGIHVLDAAELNIGLDGTLDYDLDFLLEFDVAVASIHSAMDRGTGEQTDRILAAIAHPAVTVIGHPTGRILGHRPGYGIDLRAIAEAAAETGTALEVNGSPRRLDLSGEMARVAVDAGATVALSSDAHTTGELDYVANAVPTARRGWVTAAQVLNCRDLDGFLAGIARR